MVYVNNRRKNFRYAGDINRDHDLDGIQPVVTRGIENDEENHAETETNDSQGQEKISNRSSVDRPFWVQTFSNRFVSQDETTKKSFFTFSRIGDFRQKSVFTRFHHDADRRTVRNLKEIFDSNVFFVR